MTALVTGVEAVSLVLLAWVFCHETGNPAAAHTVVFLMLPIEGCPCYVRISSWHLCTAGAESLAGLGGSLPLRECGQRRDLERGLDGSLTCALGHRLLFPNSFLQLKRFPLVVHYLNSGDHHVTILPPPLGIVIPICLLLVLTHILPQAPYLCQTHPAFFCFLSTRLSQDICTCHPCCQ